MIYPEEINNYDDTFNHVQVWIQHRRQLVNSSTWKTLTKDKGVILITGTKITINTGGTNSFPASGKNNIHIRWYPRNSVSFVLSAVKLGLIKQLIQN